MYACCLSGHTVARFDLGTFASRFRLIPTESCYAEIRELPLSTHCSFTCPELSNISFCDQCNLVAGHRDALQLHDLGIDMGLHSLTEISSAADIFQPVSFNRALHFWTLPTPNVVLCVWTRVAVPSTFVPYRSALRPRSSQLHFTSLSFMLSAEIHGSQRWIFRHNCSQGDAHRLLNSQNLL